jgi:hypothetical protein
MNQGERMSSAPDEHLPTADLAGRTGLERQWDRADEVTTEDLRVALQRRYRGVFDRLLARSDAKDAPTAVRTAVTIER